MSSKSIILSRSAASELQDRKHPRPYEDGEKESEINEPNQWLLGPERQISNRFETARVSPTLDVT